jgi:hypothetical protein
MQKVYTLQLCKGAAAQRCPRDPRGAASTPARIYPWVYSGPPPPRKKPQGNQPHAAGEGPGCAKKYIHSSYARGSGATMIKEGPWVRQAPLAQICAWVYSAPLPPRQEPRRNLLRAAGEGPGCAKSTHIAAMHGGSGTTMTKTARGRGKHPRPNIPMGIFSVPAAKEEATRKSTACHWRGAGVCKKVHPQPLCKGQWHNADQGEAVGVASPPARIHP